MIEHWVSVARKSAAKNRVSTDIQLKMVVAMKQVVNINHSILDGDALIIDSVANV